MDSTLALFFNVWKIERGKMLASTPKSNNASCYLCMASTATIMTGSGRFEVVFTLFMYLCLLRSFCTRSLASSCASLINL